MGISSGATGGIAPGDIAGVGRKPSCRGACPAGTTRRARTPTAALRSRPGADLGCTGARGAATGRRVALMGRSASSGCTASARCAATARSPARAVMGIARRRPGARRCGTRVESARGPLVGRRPACGFSAGRAVDRLGCTSGPGRACHSAGAFVE